MERCGHDVLVLVEHVTRDELMRSRITRAQVQRLLRSMADSLCGLPRSARDAMPEIDWTAWDRLRVQLNSEPGPAQQEAVWFACESLVGATLLWLRVYRKGQPGLFRMTM